MLKDYLKENNISIYALSKKSGVPYSTLNDLVNEKVQIDSCKVGVLRKIADSLELNLDTIYSLCEGTPISAENTYGTSLNISVKNKTYYCDFEYNGEPVEIELCKVNEDNKFYIAEIAKCRSERIIRERRMQSFNVD